MPCVLVWPEHRRSCIVNLHYLELPNASPLMVTKIIQIYTPCQSCPIRLKKLCLVYDTFKAMQDLEMVVFVC